VKKHKPYWLGLLVLLLLLMAWWWQRSLSHSQDGVVANAAQKYGLEPALIKAVVWRESGFHPQARGKAGEIGLMQLREDAAQEWADAEHLTGFEHEHCFDPRTNTLAGTWYLKKLLKRYRQTDNPIPYALADYNAGRANVLKWMTAEASTNSAAFIEQIGFPGTKDYVQSVMRKYEDYRQSSVARNSS
jgi:soluble lytic murein transglycosylase